MLHQTRTVIELRIGSLDESKLRVRRMTSVERLSSPYSATVEFSPTSEDFLSLQELLGAEATLTVRRPDGPERHWPDFSTPSGGERPSQIVGGCELLRANANSGFFPDA